MALLVPLDNAHAKSFRVLYAFSGGSDGAHPAAGLISDKAGNLYGTTFEGGAGGSGCGGKVGCGTVFKLAPDGTETVLHAFTGTPDGAIPYASGLIADKAGNLYGTTAYGGEITQQCVSGCGTVFKLAPDGTETVLYSFTGGSDGGIPLASLIADKSGNLYGTTGYGGEFTNCGDGGGTVFKLAPDGTETVLHAFAGAAAGDGCFPYAGLIADSAGNFYGTTVVGGSAACDSGFGCGTVFRVAPDGTETVLHAFAGGSDGMNPLGGLVADPSGNLYGTTQAGGENCNPGCGTAFKVATDGTETILHIFVGGSDGSFPNAGLALDKTGNLYGATQSGGSTRCRKRPGCGTVFELTSNGTETILHSFEAHKSGVAPLAPVLDKGLSVFGTTYLGGNTDACSHGCGVVFKLKK